MKLNRNKIRRIIREEIKNLDYKVSKSIDKIDIEADLASEVEAHEDAWAGGNNLYKSVDHLKDGGSKEKSVRGIERLKVVESLTRRQIRAMIFAEAAHNRPQSQDEYERMVTKRQEYEASIPGRLDDEPDYDDDVESDIIRSFDIRSKDTIAQLQGKDAANLYAKRQINHVIDRLQLDRRKSVKQGIRDTSGNYSTVGYLMMLMNMYGYMVDYDVDKGTIEFENYNSEDPLDIHVENVSHLRKER